MTCQLTSLPPVDDAKIAALKAKYAEQRDRRVRVEAGEQYVRTADEFAAIYEIDPYRAVEPRDSIAEDLDVAILGAGWTGLLAGYHLTKTGVSSFRHIDHAGDFGGVWYWNRYPGIQCDNESYCYLPLLEETGFMPSKRFADGLEIQEYCQFVARNYGFYDGALFHTLITALRWDEAIDRWRVTTNRGDEIRARFVVMAGGVMNMPKLPGIPGLEDFRGKTFHSARWDYEYTGGDWRDPTLSKLSDKRVAIIGTGATSIQAVPYLGRYAKELFVLQRTPSTVDERPNPPTDRKWAAALEPGWQKNRQANFHRGAMEQFHPDETDLVCDLWTEISRHLHAELAAEGRSELGPIEVAARREAIDYRVMERLRNRIDLIVEDKATAEALKPYFRFPCKRPLSNEDYYLTFNRDNVHLVDVSATQGVERITNTGFTVNGVEHEVDCIILASGFEVTSDLRRRWGIDVVEGRGGVSIYGHWSEGPSTLHGVMTHGFPNMFYTGYIQGALNASTTEQFNRQCEHIAYIISETQGRSATSVEPTREGEDAYVRHFREIEVDLSSLVRECTPSYYSNEADSRMTWVLLRAYGHGWDAFMDLLTRWRQKGDLEGLALKVAEVSPVEAELAPPAGG